MGRNRKRPVYCCDFETTSEKQYEVESKTRVYLWCLKSLDESITHMGVDIKSFMDTLSTLEYSILIYFHNLSFDGEFILWHILEQGYEYQEEIDKSYIAKTFEPIIDEMGSIYCIKIRLENLNVVEIRCSYKLFPKSIEDIGEMVGVKKLKETHNYDELKNYGSINDIPDEEISYISNDVIIMCRLIKYLNEVGINSMTMSTSAYKNWRKDKYMLCKNELIKDENEEINEIVRKSYRGGITKPNNKYCGQLIENAMSFDVNSLYPSVMYENPMPIGMGKIYNTIEECINDKRPLYIVVLAVPYAKVKKGMHSFIGNQSGFSYIRKYSYDDEMYNKTLYLWDKEYKLFNMIYENNAIISKVVGYKCTCNVFKDYIERWYKVKENAKTPAERQLAKLMLNSLYGKFGMNSHRVSKIPYYENGVIKYKYKDNDTTYYDKKIASFITSRARVKYATMMNLCGDDFLYGDTDSVYIKGSEIPKQFKGIIDDKKMGYWAYEGHYKKFKVLKAKCYIKQLDNGEIVRKISGCPTECSHLINFENFEFGLKLEGVKKCKRKVRGGVIIGKTDFTINC